MDARWRNLRAPLVVAAGSLMACGVVYAVSPADSTGVYPPCPTKLITGYDCPLCGSLRATHSLLHGDVVTAIDLNAATVLVLYPALLVAFAFWVVRSWRGERFELRIPVWATVVVGVGLLAFTVVRNLPGMPLGTTA